MFGVWSNRYFGFKKKALIETHFARFSVGSSIHCLMLSVNVEEELSTVSEVGVATRTWPCSIAMETGRPGGVKALLDFKLHGQNKRLLSDRYSVLPEDAVQFCFEALLSSASCHRPVLCSFASWHCPVLSHHTAHFCLVALFSSASCHCTVLPRGTVQFCLVLLLTSASWHCSVLLLVTAQFCLVALSSSVSSYCSVIWRHCCDATVLGALRLSRCSTKRREADVQQRFCFQNWNKQHWDALIPHISLIIIKT